MRLLLFVLAIPVIQARFIEGPVCKISIDYRKGDLREPQPLILTDSEEPDFILPDEKKVLIINSNTSVTLACPGFKNAMQGFGKKQLIKATCHRDKQFLVDNKVHEFSTFKCASLPKETVRKTKIPCVENIPLYEIGYILGKNFLRLMHICRNDTSMSTYYTKSTLVKELSGFQSSFPRPSWKQGSFYSGYNMLTVYKQKSQLRSMGNLLSSEELAEKYINSKDGQFLNRGHLAAKADFVFGSHQSTTFWLLNTAPQWATFNAGNWLVIENSVRELSISRKKNLNVYTGVHGVSYLDDVNGNKQDIYLHANDTHKAFPVPMFFWKVVHEPVQNLGVAFVGLNNPHVEEVTKDMYLCSDLSADPAYSWIKWEPNNIKLGVAYICSVDDLRKSIPTIPDIAHVGLLT